MSRDSYTTLAEHAEFRQKIERSEFLGIAFPIESEEAFFEELKRVEKKYFDATHHCWAFRLLDRERSSDAGEPNGTAGKPILSAIHLNYTGVVVVRWFGGVKLGPGGLARAYRDTAAETLKQAKSVERFDYARFEVIVPFEMLNQAYRLIDPPHVVLASESFAEQNVFTFDVRRSRVEDFAGRLSDLRLAFRA